MEVDYKWRIYAKSAYQVQFKWNFTKIKIMPIWKAKAKKVSFSTWTLLHQKNSNNKQLVQKKLATWSDLQTLQG